MYQKIPSSGLPAASTETSLFKYADEQFSVRELPGNACLILSAKDSLAIGKTTAMADLTVYDHVSIFADSLIVEKTVKAKNCLVSTWNITGDAAPCLDVSGDPGEDAGPLGPGDTTGQDGYPGGNGGNIDFFIGNPPFSVFPIHLNAAGGKGGNASGTPLCTQGGTGGSGGNGGRISIAIQNRYDVLLEQMKTAYDAKAVFISLKLDALDAATTITDPAVQEALATEVSSLAQACGVSEKGSDLRTTIGAIKDKAYGMDSEHKKTFGNQCNTSIRNFSETLIVQKNLCFSNIIPAFTNVSLGQGGAYGEGIAPGGKGTDGSAGKASLVSQETMAKTVSQAGFPCVHPDQCRMMLQKAKMLYFTADAVERPDNYADAAILLKRIILLTQAFGDNITAEDKSRLEKLYKQSGEMLGTMDALDSLSDIYTESKMVLNQLKNGNDYFGYADNHVPLAAYSFYDGLITSLLKNLKSMEDAYNQYFTNLKDHEKKMAAITASKSMGQKVIESGRDKLKLLKVYAEDTVTAVSILDTKAKTAKSEVKEKLKDFKEAIKNAVGFDPGDLLSALSMCAFAPESSILIGSQVGSVMLNSMETVKTGPEGTGVRKDYLIGKISATQADFQSLDEGFHTMDDGTVEPDDPGANKLIVIKQDLDRFLDQFYGKFPKKAADLKSDFEQYVNIIINRNNKLLYYNAIVTLMVSNQTQIDDTQKKLAALNDQALKTLNPDLPDIVMFISRLYHDARTQVMYELYLTGRAYRFWALADDDPVSKTLGENPPSDIDHAMLVAVQSQILTQYQGKTEERARDSQRFPKNEDDPGLIYRFDGETLQDYIDQLKSDKEIYFKIPTAFQDTSKEDNAFAGLADVRITRVRAWVDGAKTKDGKLRVDLQHQGNEDMVAVNGDIFTFSHDPVPVAFSYYTDTKNIFIEGNLETGEQSDVYARIGPFALWRLAIKEEWNMGLDLSGVTDIYLEFFGQFYPFSTA